MEKCESPGGATRQGPVLKQGLALFALARGDAARGRAMGAMVGGEAAALVVKRQASAQGARAQKRKPRKDGWNRAKEQIFLQTLAETCNATEAARVAGVCRASAYKRRQTDRRFAAEWERVRDIGYAEIEAMLMREVLFGSESEEIVLDGEGAVKSRKIKRGRDLKLALQLLTRHREQVARYRATMPDREGPGSEDALARMKRVLDEIRKRRAETGT